MKCVACDKEAEYIYLGKSLCAKCFDVWVKRLEEKPKEDETHNIKKNQQ